MDISAWIAHWARWAPGRAALRFEGVETSYAKLEDDVACAASWLGANGVTPGDRVAFLGPNCPELLEVLFACARIGAVFVPLNARMPAAELRTFLELTEPRLVVAEHELREVAVDSGAFGAIESFVAGRGPEAFSGQTTDGDPRLGPAPDSGPAAPVLIAFTSGTTGRPKGATFTHEHLTFNAIKAITAFGVTAADEVLTAIPMFHVGGLLIHTMPALFAGATNTIHRQFDPSLVLDGIQRHRVTLLACVPAMTRALSTHPAWPRADLSSLRHVLTGSTLVQRSAIEPWQRRGVPIAQGYGLTETCAVITSMPPTTSVEIALSVGKPVLYHQVRVVDPTGRDLPAGERGEVWIRGRCVMQDYWRNAEATRDAFHDGWLRSGDVGMIDAEGYLHIVDRMKDVIIVGSSNVYPSDVEAVLVGCPDIAEAAVVGRPDDELGEVPVACVVPVPGRSLTSAQVIALCGGRLATYKHPRDVLFLDAMPRNATGKVDRKALGAAVRTAAELPTVPFRAWGAPAEQSQRIGTSVERIGAGRAVSPMR